MFDVAALQDLVSHHSAVARVVVARVKGSAPREVGASMFVWKDGQSGTIGGGTLEYQAANFARNTLTGMTDGANPPETKVARLPLGPAVNQCCGGAVTLVTEFFDASTLPTVLDDAALRRVEGSGDVPRPMVRAIHRSRAMDAPVPMSFSGGWICEPARQAETPVYIYGAGHVGIALANILHPLPQFRVVLADDRPDCAAQAPVPVLPIAQAHGTAPANARHYIMTHAHDLDLSLCHALLSKQNAGIGLIGSQTKWARFRKRLMALGHTPMAVERIVCPIGDPSLGKHPQAIALGVASELLRKIETPITNREAV